MADITTSGKTELEIVHQDRFKVELSRGQRGTYGWTVTTYASSLGDILSNLAEADKRLKEAYGNNNTGE